MTNQFSDLVRIIGITILITFLWASSAAFTYWDIQHQHMPAKKALLWLAVVVLLPFVGFMLYILSRAIKLFTQPSHNTSNLKARYSTPFKPPVAKRQPLPTLHVSSLGRPTVAEPQKDLPFAADQPVRAAKCVFTITSGADLGREFAIEYLPARIGRGSQVCIRLDADLGVSREHAEVYERTGGLWIRDLNSTHGTQVNGLRVEEQRLVPGDHIQIGSTTLVVSLSGE